MKSYVRRKEVIITKSQKKQSLYSMRFTVLMLISLPFQPVLMLWLTAASLVLALFGMMLLAAVLCPLGGYKLRGMGKTILMYPVFMASWIPVQIAALFIPVKTWHEIRHEGQPDAKV